VIRCRYCILAATFKLTFTDVDRRTRKETTRSALACNGCASTFRDDASVLVEPFIQHDDETRIVDVPLVEETKAIAVEELRLLVQNSLQVWLTLRPEQALRLAEYDDAGPREVAAAQPLELRVLRALYRLIQEHLDRRSN
jgi:hypothetical protein